jgi:hypothetical protein
LYFILEKIYLYFEYHIKIDLGEKGLRGMHWIHLAQEEPMEGSCEHGNEI